MNIFEAILLGILQGITEFLPISSSGHLIIAEHFLGLDVENLRSFDVIVHLGTLFSILIYFRKEFKNLFTEVLRFDFSTLKLLIIGTIPAVIIGFSFANEIDDFFRDIKMVAIAMIFAGIFFLVAEFLSKKVQLSKVLNWKKSLFIGLVQAVALIPGVSRSGTTISGGLMAGLSRVEAAKYSFMLGSIAIFGAGVLTFKDVVSEGLYLPSASIIIVGLISSFLSGYFAVSFLMKFLATNSLRVFSVYLFILGFGVLLFA